MRKDGILKGKKMRPKTADRLANVYDPGRGRVASPENQFRHGVNFSPYQVPNAGQMPRGATPEPELPYSEAYVQRGVNGSPLRASPRRPDANG